MMQLAFTLPTLQQTVIFVFAAAIPLAFTVWLIRYISRREAEQQAKLPQD